MKLGTDDPYECRTGPQPLFDFPFYKGHSVTRTKNLYSEIGCADPVPLNWASFLDSFTPDKRYVSGSNGVRIPM